MEGKSMDIQSAYVAMVVVGGVPQDIPSTAYLQL